MTTAVSPMTPGAPVDTRNVSTTKTEEKKQVVTSTPDSISRVDETQTQFSSMTTVASAPQKADEKAAPGVPAAPTNLSPSESAEQHKAASGGACRRWRNALGMIFGAVAVAGIVIGSIVYRKNIAQFFTKTVPAGWNSFAAWVRGLFQK